MFKDAQQFSRLRNLSLTALVLLSVCCKSKIREVHPISPKREYLGSTGDKNQSIPVLEKRKRSTPADLLVKNISFSAKELGGNLYPHIKFNVNEATEAVSWQICSSTLGRCKEGVTTRPEISISGAYAGRLIAKLCPCLFSDPGQEKVSCGTCSTVETSIFQNTFNDEIDGLIKEKESFKQNLQGLGEKWLQLLVSYESAYEKDSSCRGIKPIIAPEVMENFKNVGKTQLGESIVDLALIDLSGTREKNKNDQKAGIAESVGYGTTALAGAFGFSYALGTAKFPSVGPKVSKYMRIAGISGATIATFAAVGLYIFAAKAGSKGTSEGNSRKAAILNRVGYAMGTFLQLSTVVTAVGVYKQSKLVAAQAKLKPSISIKNPSIKKPTLNPPSTKNVIKGGIIAAVSFAVLTAAMHISASTLQLADVCSPNKTFLTHLKSIQREVEESFKKIDLVEDKITEALAKSTYQSKF